LFFAEPILGLLVLQPRHLKAKCKTCALEKPDRYEIMRPELVKELLEKISRDGDHQAFQILFETYAPKIKGYMMREGADPATADELAQEALASVWHKAEMYSPEKGNPVAWIFTIVRHLRIDRLRKERVWEPLPEDHSEQMSEDAAQDELLTQQERLKALNQALNTLPQEQLEVVRLSYLDGLAHSQVAKHLGLPLGTVKSRMRRAYQNLKPFLETLR
jgi:RNA polymerase sigma-70 factor (ECF subfamily)